MRLGLVILISVSVMGCRETPPATKTAVDVNGPRAANPVAGPTDGGVVEASPAPAVAVAPAAASTQKPKPAKIKLTIRSLPPKALVSWGKKKLGETPVILERPRESGPMDLEVRADGYFTVHTRAYTFHNEVLYVKLTKLADKMTLFGAKQDLEPSPSPAPLP
jgi:PEGA domain